MILWSISSYSLFYLSKNKSPDSFLSAYLFLLRSISIFSRAKSHHLSFHRQRKSSMNHSRALEIPLHTRCSTPRDKTMTSHRPFSLSLRSGTVWSKRFGILCYSALQSRCRRRGDRKENSNSCCSFNGWISWKQLLSASIWKCSISKSNSSWNE